MSKYIIGLDLDNTIVNYDNVFHMLAIEQGLVDIHIPMTKAIIRDTIRKRHGDIAWQKLQWKAYGERMQDAVLYPFIFQALTWFSKQNIPVYVISHKTEYANIDTEKTTNLRECALNFLEKQNFFSFVPREHIIFCTSRLEKCNAISDSKCTDFIDDLPEMLGDVAFPSHVHKILFCPKGLEFPPIAHCSILRRFDALPLFFASQTEKKRVYGGRNSRVWRWDSCIGTVAVKDVCCVEHDSRQRDVAEWRAWCFLEEQGFHKQPLALIRDVQRKQIVSTWIDGTIPQQIKGNHVEELAIFFEELYLLKEYAKVLPQAADACFSLQALHNHVQERINRLLNVESKQGVAHSKLRAFLTEKLIPACSDAMAYSAHLFTEKGICADMELPMSLRIPSPSDFGIHNAIQTNEGLKFIDFEYFGHDDPVKLLCDTILHPAKPFSENERQVFFENVFEKCQFITTDKNFLIRFKAYFPLWRIVWVCILLNDFLLSGQNRRRIATEDAVASEDILQKQLQKAEQMLQKNTPSFEFAVTAYSKLKLSGC